MRRKTAAERDLKAPGMRINEQAAIALLSASFSFLLRNGISQEFIAKLASNFVIGQKPEKNLREYRDLVRNYDHMGVIMATWFSNPKFLDKDGRPVPIDMGKTGAQSLAALLRVSGAKIKFSRALHLMKSSPSIACKNDGMLHAARRVFVMPELEVPWAAFIVERYLDTLLKNVSSRKNRVNLLLERSCYVSAVDLAKAAPLLRDIETRATAFMNSVDGELEGKRLRRSTRKNAGELGVLVFAWTQPQLLTKKRS